jgi:molecular chaperone GrpE
MSNDSIDEQSAPGAETAADTPDGESEIDALRQQAEDNWTQYVRAAAEIENLRKRHARDLENARKFGAERLAAALLPVRDSMEAGLKAAGEADPTTLDVETLLAGEQATLRLLDQALEEAGIREIDPVGQPFDPTEHEAMSMQPSDSAAPGSVLLVVQKGYAIHERVMRPARVIVAREAADDGAG